MRRLTIAVVLIAIVPGIAHANMVWPAIYLEARLMTWWAIAGGLLIEYLFLRKLFRMSTKKALYADVGINAASAALGIILIPLEGIAWELVPGMMLYNLNVGTFNPITWAATFLFAILINTKVETSVLKKCFKEQVGKRGFWGLACANALSVSAAFGSLWFFPFHP